GAGIDNMFSYTAIEGDGTYTFYTVATDKAGNVEATPAADADSTVLDTVAPSASIAKAGSQPDPTNSSPIHFTVTFSEPVTGFSSAGLTLGGTSGGTKSATVNQIAPNDGTTYDVAVSGMTSNGTVTATVNANAAQDAATNGNTASGTASVNYD